MKSHLILLSAVLASTAGSAVADNALASEKLGHHPAVLVANTWNARGIDTNTFIVAHPARLQLIGTTAGDKSAPRVADVK
ncbi:MAG TPA: hypothetical protein VGD45_00590 [Steroidobacter sp.]|uniref:hypothetical protein n=1 Tax=Steroidobacter sp. TaxID=1978227 RepID=UPI002EDB426F